MAGALSLGDSLSHWKQRAGHGGRSLPTSRRWQRGRCVGGHLPAWSRESGGTRQRVQGPRGRLQLPGRAQPRAGASVAPWLRGQPWSVEQIPVSAVPVGVWEKSWEQGQWPWMGSLGRRERCDLAA